MAPSPLTRRSLITTAVAGAAASLAPSVRSSSPQAALPVAVGSVNALAAVQRAVERMLAGDLPVDAAVAGVSLNEDDPNEIGVGYGGIPNEEGVVQLDAAVMDGTTMAAGAVAALEGIRHPSHVALEVMRRTTRVLLVGEGAKRFALAHGFKEENLLTERARKIWLHWKDTASPSDDWLPDPAALDDPDLKWFLERDGGDAFNPHGTVHVSALDAAGRVGCCTSTSGLYFKLPGRVGDSPLIGCGLYCDGEVGSAGATGHGESCILAAGAHTVVEFMRHGATPTEACLETLRRVVRNTRRPFLLDAKGRPKNGLSLYALNLKGEVGAAATYRGRRFAVCRAGAPARLEEAAYLFASRD